MSLSTEEINKVNDLYKRIDVLEAENNTLKESSAHDHTDLEDKLTNIESKLDKLLKSK